MNITIEQESIEQAASESVTKALKQSFDSYKIQDILQKSVESSLIDSVIMEATVAACKSINLEMLTAHIAKELAETIQTSIVLIVEEASINMLLKLRGVKDYASEADIQLAKQKARIDLRTRNTLDES